MAGRPWSVAGDLYPPLARTALPTGGSNADADADGAISL
jgi:hypothetical protein